MYQNFNQLDVLDVKDNITFSLGLDGVLPDMEYIEKICRILGIDHKLDAIPIRLSRGEQQRVAIARALVAKPDILLADEPTGNLDSANSAEVVQLLSAGCRKLGQTIVMITHDEKIAAFADEVIRIEDGKILKGGK